MKIQSKTQSMKLPLLDNQFIFPSSNNSPGVLESKLTLQDINMMKRLPMELLFKKLIILRFFSQVKDFLLLNRGTLLTVLKLWRNYGGLYSQKFEC